MKKSITILMFIILLFLIPSFCSAYSINDTANYNKFYYKNIDDFLTDYPNATRVKNFINSWKSNYQVLAFSFTINDITYCYGVRNIDNNNLVVPDISYINNAMSCFGTGRANQFAVCRADGGSLTGGTFRDLSINDLQFCVNYVSGKDWGNLEVKDATIYYNQNSIGLYYNDSINNFNINYYQMPSEDPVDPEDPDEPSGEIIDYTSKFDYIINILYLNVFLQFLLVIYYVIRSTFRID